MLCWWRWLIGQWRMQWGFCPRCNSDAPELDTCQVCEGYRTPYPPAETTLEMWWTRYEGRIGEE